MSARIDIKNMLFYLTVILLWFTAFAHYHSEGLNHVAIYVVAPLMAIVAWAQNNKLQPGRWFVWQMILYVWVGLTTVFAFNREVALDEMHRILGCILFSFTIAISSQSTKHIPWLYGLYILLFVCAVAYAKREILPYTTFGEGRITNETLNANTLAYYTFFYTFITFLMGEIISSPIWKQVWRVVFFTAIPVVYLVAIATASRQVMLICAPLLAFMIVYRYLLSKSTPRWQKAIAILALVSLFAYALPHALEMYQGSQLSTRNELSVQEDERMILLREAVEVGCKHPVFGVGPGNFLLFSSPHVFSHCTYLELFANTGIIGALIYIFIVGAFCLINWKRWRQTHDSTFFCFLLFGCFYALYQFFYVWYTDNWLISFFILVCTHSDTYYRSIIESNTPIPIYSD